MPKIGLPTEHTMHQIHVKSYRSYKKALNDLVSWGLIELRNKSHNQYTCNEVALVLKTKAKTKAKAKAEPAYINSKNINKPNGLKPEFLNDDAR